LSKLKNKVVVITGASSGIGLACAKAFARHGAKLSLAARNEEKLTQLAGELSRQGVEVLTVKTDVSRREDCQSLITQTVEKYGGIDILVNNAGISMRALFADLELEVLEQLMNTNFWGMVYCTKYAMPYLLKSRGSIIGVSSIAGYRGLPGRVGYSASKFAMQGFLEALRTENLKKGIHVMVLCPGFTASNIRNTALDAGGLAQKESPRDEQKMMQPEEVANHLIKGIGKRKREVILTRQGKMTVFMNKWFPGFMDKMVFNHMSKEKDSPF